MLLVKTPLGRNANGARRWLNLGPLSFQPSGLAKIAVIVCLSYMIVNMGRKIGTLKGFMMLAGSGGALAFITYVFTDNLSTAIIIFGITIGLIFYCTSKSKTIPHYWYSSGCCYCCYQLLKCNDGNRSSFRLRRILVWLHPEDYASRRWLSDDTGIVWVDQEGFWEKDLETVSRSSSVPGSAERYDLFYCMKELGILGGMIVLLLFAYLLYRLFFIAQNASDLFGSLIVSGIFYSYCTAGYF